MKCTSNCALFGLYKYDAANSNGATARYCVANCPSGLIADPSTDKCVPRCPDNWYYVIENRDSDPKCTDNCTSGYEYDLMNECVSACPSGYFVQIINTHKKCVQTCTGAFGDNVTRACVLFCPTPSFADKTNQLCVEECTNSRYEQVAIANGNRTCETAC